MFTHVFKFIAVALSCALLSSALVPNKSRQQWLKTNGPAAKALNDQYVNLKPHSPCNQVGHVACAQSQPILCYNGTYLPFQCSSGLVCAAIPNEWSEGTTTACNKEGDIKKLFSEAKVHQTRGWLSLADDAFKVLDEVEKPKPTHKSHKSHH